MNRAEVIKQIYNEGRLEALKWVQSLLEELPTNLIWVRQKIKEAIQEIEMKGGKENGNE